MSYIGATIIQSYNTVNKYQLSESISSINYKSGALHKVLSSNNHKSCAISCLSALVPCAVIHHIVILEDILVPFLCAFEGVQDHFQSSVLLKASFRKISRTINPHFSLVGRIPINLVLNTPFPPYWQFLMEALG
jgi:hypothetical protein